MEKVMSEKFETSPCAEDDGDLFRPLQKALIVIIS